MTTDNDELSFRDQTVEIVVLALRDQGYPDLTLETVRSNPAPHLGHCSVAPNSASETCLSTSSSRVHSRDPLPSPSHGSRRFSFSGSPHPTGLTFGGSRSR
jgi:hypothetical protein